MQTQLPTDPLQQLLPLALEWAHQQEERVLREGQPLSAEQLADAKVIGVCHPERVRILAVETIPAPSHPVLKAARERIELLPAAPSGLTLQYGILVRRGSLQDRNLIAHELVHTSQCERLGGIRPFLAEYLRQCATVGYDQAPLEREANMIAERVCVSG